MQNVKVSVWCLAYNHGKYIEKTLQGFVNQKTDFDYEIIIHDDASTDETAEIIKRYAEVYPNIIIPFFEEENQYSKRVNVFTKYFIPNARGKYYAFCDGDDYWSDENKLQKQYNILEAYNDVSMCVHRVQHIEENGEIISDEYEPSEGILDKDTEISQLDFADLLFVKSGYPFHTSSYFIRSQVIREHNEDYVRMSGTMNGDQVLMRFALLGGGIYYINSIMSMRRIGAPYSYNVRKREWGYSQRIDNTFSRCSGELLFDEISKGIYRDIIGTKILSEILNYLPELSEKPFIDWISKNAKQYLKCRGVRIKYKIKYWCFRIMPRLSKIVWKVFLKMRRVA